MRGTSSIPYSCLLTMFACIYTALHLDIPRVGSNTLHPLTTKLIWSLTALLAPELVLFCASSQFFQARKLAKYMRNLYESKTTAAESVNPEKVGSILLIIPFYLDIKLEGYLPKRSSACLT